jgi:FixJ family two-component response regulator
MARALHWFRQIASKGTAKRDCKPDGGITLLAIGMPENECLSLEAVGAVEYWDKAYVRTLQDGMDMLATRQFAVILLDRDVCGTEWPTAIERLAKSASGSCIFLVSTVSDEYLWRAVVQHGGFDVISKPLQTDQLRRGVGRAWLFWKSDTPERLAKRSS